jgi:hypothetical protein
MTSLLSQSWENYSWSNIDTSLAYTKWFNLHLVLQIAMIMVATQRCVEAMVDPSPYLALQRVNGLNVKANLVIISSNFMQYEKRDETQTFDFILSVPLLTPQPYNYISSKLSSITSIFRIASDACRNII